MNRFLKIVNFEMNRFMKIYLVLILLTIVLQFTAVIVKCLSYMKQANSAIYEQSVTKAQFIADNGLLRFNEISGSMWFIAPIAISATVLIGYVFLIWYRDWFAKNTFIYRLLMLPTSRLNVYFSKAAAILLFVLGLIALEIILLPIEILLFDKMVPSDFRLDLPIPDVISSYSLLSTILPGTFIQFILYYAMGFMLVLTLFTGILFERSFGWKGIPLAVLYAALSFLLFISPFIFMAVFNSNSLLYPNEFLLLEIILGLLVIIMAIFVSRFLLMKKITV